MFTARSLIIFALMTALPASGQPQEPASELPEIISSSTAAGSVEFPHSMHALDLEIECETCHHETNAATLSIPHEEYFEDFWIECQTCHRAGAASADPQPCSACHHSSPTTVADETLSAKVVIHQNCFECHEGGTGREASQSCALCHQPLVSDAEKREAVEFGGNQHG